jgi:hypothetical protein
VTQVEFRQEEIDKQLHEGAESFVSIRKAIDDVQDQVRPKPVPTWKIVAVAITAMALLGGWVWQAAQYPNRDEFEAVRAETSEIKMEQVRIQADLRAMREGQKNIERSIREIAGDVKDIARDGRLCIPPTVPTFSK